MIGHSDGLLIRQVSKIMLPWVMMNGGAVVVGLGSMKKEKKKRGRRGKKK